MSFPFPVETEDDSLTESGPSTNWQVKRTYLICSFQGKTWTREIQIYNYVFLQDGPRYDSPDRRNFITGYHALSPQMVNLLMYNKQMEKATLLARSARAQTATPQAFDPMFQFREARVAEAFWPCGVTDTPPEELKRILGSMGNERTINIINQGQVQCANYWGNNVRGGYHLYFVLKMLDVDRRDPVFHVSFGGTPGSKYPSHPSVKQVPHWFAIAVSDKKYIDQARKYTLRTTDATGKEVTEERLGEAVYVGICFYNMHYDRSNDVNGPPIVERSVTSQEFTTSQKYMEILALQQI